MDYEDGEATEAQSLNKRVPTLVESGEPWLAGGLTDRELRRLVEPSADSEDDE